MKSPLKISALLILALAASTTRAAESPDRPTVIVVIGAPGEPQYASDFLKAADAWADACKRANVTHIEIGRPDPTTTTTAPAQTTPAKTDRQLFQAALEAQSQSNSSQPLWIVLLGHGTFDGKEAKFNLRDLDFSDTELAAWLKPLNRPIALLDCSSASAPFLAKCSAPNRVIITATRAGTEVNYARFGLFLANAIANPAADLDKDGQTSLLEAFLAASHNTQDFYESQGRLATEHALIDDNGDAQGTPAEAFQGTRATPQTRPAPAARSGAPRPATPDGTRAHQWFLIPSTEEQSLTPQTRAQRDALELQIESLRQKKSSLPESDYYTQLDTLLVALARIQVHNADVRP